MMHKNMIKFKRLTVDIHCDNNIMCQNMSVIAEVVLAAVAL